MKRVMLIAASLLLAGCTAAQLTTTGGPRPAPTPKKFSRPLDLADLRKEMPVDHSATGKIIYIGVYGG